MKKILIVVDTSRIAGRQLLSGVERYISAFARWQVYTQRPDYLHSSGQQLFDMEPHHFDGLFICDAVNISSLLKVPTPKVVNSIHKEINPGASSIITNSDKIGAMAADYLISLGFRHFAWCGFADLPWSTARSVSYSRYLRQRGFESVHHYDPAEPGSGEEHDKIARWLRRLPKPVCVFACNDDRALYVLEACKLSNLSVPEQVAVLGVDDDRLVCNLSWPPLSSVRLDFENAGFAAARHLDELMQGGARSIISVEPVEIVERQSTDVLAVEDPRLLAALIFIRNNFEKPVQADDVVKAAGLSRRELEYRFKSTLKRTIKQEIDRQRINFIKKQLLNSDQRVGQIAHSLHFTDPEHFSRYFKNLVGMTPGQFRKRTL